MAIGVLLNSASDVPGPIRKRVKAVLLASLLTALITIVVSLAAVSKFLLIPVLLILMFFVSFLAIYGFRASLISFSGLLAAVLALADISGAALLLHAFLIGFGGLWYLFLNLVVYFFNPQKQEEDLLAECFELTASYIRIRSKLLSQAKNRIKLQEKLLFLQNDINEKHESLREALISTRKSSGSSQSLRQKLYVFIELVDILELAMANPVDYKKMDLIFKKEKKLKEYFSNHILKTSEHLNLIAEAIRKDKPAPSSTSLKDSLYQIERQFDSFKTKNNDLEGKEMLFVLHNMLDYQEKQYNKINIISRILANQYAGFSKVKSQEAVKFLTPQQYNFRIFRENFNFGSSIFKHALRLALVVIIGLLIGFYFELQNSYWILLTAIVILRPNYGLTKERSKERTIGTLAGAAVAAFIVYLIQDPVVYAVFGIISFLLAFSFIQKNYRWAAGFITLNVVFVYALLSPNAFNVIQFRVLDTLIGAALAYLSILFLWPSWEHEGIEKLFKESIEANKAYLKEIQKLYVEKTTIPTSYKLSRKRAFLAMGDLSAAFQRMTQEPKNKQKDISRIYENVVLNQTLLSSAASFGTFIQNHSTTAASNHFKILVTQVMENLDKAIAKLQQEEFKEYVDKEKLKEAEHFLQKKYKKLMLNAKFPNDSNDQPNKILEFNLQEYQLIMSQIKWLTEVSDKLQKNITANSAVFKANVET